MLDDREREELASELALYQKEEATNADAGPWESQAAYSEMSDYADGNKRLMRRIEFFADAAETIERRDVFLGDTAEYIARSLMGLNTDKLNPETEAKMRAVQAVARGLLDVVLFVRQTLPGKAFSTE